MPQLIPEWLRKLMGERDSPVDPNFAKQWPELEQKWAGREIEMPTETQKVRSVAPMGMLTKFLNPDAYAATGLLGGIQLNRELIEKDKQDLGDVLVHELAHIGQGKKGFLRKYYEPNKVEEEAVNKEALRKVRRGDIYLRPHK